VLGGWLADRLPRRLAYAGAGVFMALSSVALAVSPREPWAFVVFTGVYNFFVGVAYASFTGFVLETIGRGAASTKYNIFAALANFAFWYSGSIDSPAPDAGGGPRGSTPMLAPHAAPGVRGVVGPPG